jgi:hypothetical protein
MTKIRLQHHSSLAGLASRDVGVRTAPSRTVYQPTRESFVEYMRRFSALLVIACVLAISPESRAAAPFRTDRAFAVAEDVPAGTHLWCVFPEFRAHWVVTVYEKQRRGTFGARYTALMEVTKPDRASGPLLRQMMTVPPHAGRECFLVAYRDSLQQPYHGYTEYNPFGWRTFGVQPPVQALVVQIPRGTYAKDISNYERMMWRQWKMPAR